MREPKPGTEAHAFIPAKDYATKCQACGAGRNRHRKSFAETEEPTISDTTPHTPEPDQFYIAPSTGHGKACRGCAKTGTLQLRKRTSGGFMLLKQFRFTNGDEDSLRKAYIKARAALSALRAKTSKETE